MPVKISTPHINLTDGETEAKYQLDNSTPPLVDHVTLLPTDGLHIYSLTEARCADDCSEGSIRLRGPRITALFLSHKSSQDLKRTICMHQCHKLRSSPTGSSVSHLDHRNFSVHGLEVLKC